MSEQIKFKSLTVDDFNNTVLTLIHNKINNLIYDFVNNKYDPSPDIVGRIYSRSFNIFSNYIANPYLLNYKIDIIGTNLVFTPLDEVTRSFFEKLNMYE